ncbi:hypothetical protein [Silvimonas amylolytica]|uniref:Uncharacterized protein n=1 Tax=Silvimonas amylolytica TaxID=449663 RepID=A0ABQ2PR75_9NEIS|nr:hypothetical protein [Silvimonas amylolytica]GGP28138.1 hypothetical protein GCM10010971_39570 [Silvimonas amylolytica]
MLIAAVLALLLSSASFVPEQTAPGGQADPDGTAPAGGSVDLFSAWAVILITDWQRWRQTPWR